ncbi:phospho-N-acetylmuramoyl-pentapeptide-transferase [Leptolyngbya sp. FACHB-711]|uniref:phospho-N-acetylmuramoyl-pentapeptide- transferase n=1 Tax=unclassified Leptolyngbya TaxID=2650499 RepID=UPI0016847AB9|nr:phospho-N-acetylmuramoyl-pentapeptide-transferase [Cyanobacteria bacterium FACHB-502]MBD2027371.1 phospho-N-acetylmuramoyl-pentapeptide-transferase [Leptolyngbya sp. FACHB-711]
MDAKLIPDRPLGLGGYRTFLTLCSGLGAAALILDSVAERAFLAKDSLILPLVVSMLVAGALGYWVVPLLRALKAGQIIRQEGPQAHLKKAGTPTMGGLFFVPAAVLLALVWTGFQPNVVAVSALTLAYAAIGWYDDWQILSKKSNKGISPRMKLALQVGFGGLFCLWAALTQPATITTLTLPLGFMLPLGLLFFPLAWFVLVAESNATNLTDGLDGLAGGTGSIALLGLAALVAPNSPELATFCVCLSGGCLGFLVHNHHPARVFMGDTGSLALGGALAAVAILTQSLFGLFLLSGVFFAETLSVIAQVSYYKATKDANGIGKRLLKMSPLHHHFELSGWTETQVVGRFYLAGAVLAIVSLLMLQ